MNKTGKILLGIGVAALLAALGFWLVEQGYTLEEIQESIAASPGWIFIILLVALPPLGVPLTFFLLAVGARFGYLNGSLIACAAVFAHHLIAVGLSSVVMKVVGESEKGKALWDRLEEKVGEDQMGKLVFLFAFVPGPPYLIKLYLPQAMGVSRKLFVLASSSAHLFGVFLFVGLGRALLEGNTKLIAAFAVGIVALTIVVNIVKNRHSGKATKASPT